MLGVCYYPEHWPVTLWADDARRMRALGITYVRIGEFAWSRIEPEPGRFDWDWLDRAIAVLGKAGLRVVLGHADRDAAEVADRPPPGHPAP